MGYSTYLTGIDETRIDNFAKFNTLAYNSKWSKQRVLKGEVSLYH
jgi:hypothetical protein